MSNHHQQQQRQRHQHTATTVTTRRYPHHRHLPNHRHQQQPNNSNTSMMSVNSTGAIIPRSEGTGRRHVHEYPPPPPHPPPRRRSDNEGGKVDQHHHGRLGGLSSGKITPSKSSSGNDNDINDDLLRDLIQHARQRSPSPSSSSRPSSSSSNTVIEAGSNNEEQGRRRQRRLLGAVSLSPPPPPPSQRASSSSPMRRHQHQHHHSTGRTTPPPPSSLHSKRHGSPRLLPHQQQQQSQHRRQQRNHHHQHGTANLAHHEKRSLSPSSLRRDSSVLRGAEIIRQQIQQQLLEYQQHQQQATVEEEEDLKVHSTALVVREDQQEQQRGVVVRSGGYSGEIVPSPSHHYHDLSKVLLSKEARGGGIRAQQQQRRRTQPTSFESKQQQHQEIENQRQRQHGRSGGVITTAASPPPSLNRSPRPSWKDMSTGHPWMNDADLKRHHDKRRHDKFRMMDDLAAADMAMTTFAGSSSNNDNDDNGVPTPVVTPDRAESKTTKDKNRGRGPFGSLARRTSVSPGKKKKVSIRTPDMMEEEEHRVGIGRRVVGRREYPPGLREFDNFANNSLNNNNNDEQQTTTATIHPRCSLVGLENVGVNNDNAIRRTGNDDDASTEYTFMGRDGKIRTKTKTYLVEPILDPLDAEYEDHAQSDDYEEYEFDLLYERIQADAGEGDDDDLVNNTARTDHDHDDDGNDDHGRVTVDENIDHRIPRKTQSPSPEKKIRNIQDDVGGPISPDPRRLQHAPKLGDSPEVYLEEDDPLQPNYLKPPSLIHHDKEHQLTIHDGRHCAGDHQHQPYPYRRSLLDDDDDDKTDSSSRLEGVCASGEEVRQGPPSLSTRSSDDEGTTTMHDDDDDDPAAASMTPSSTSPPPSTASTTMSMSTASSSLSSVVSPLSSQYAELMEDKAFLHAQSAGHLWQSIVGQHVRFPKHWFNGARTPLLGLVDHEDAGGQVGGGQVGKVAESHQLHPEKRWQYHGRYPIRGKKALNGLIKHRGSPGRILLHLIVLDMVTGMPVRDVAVGGFHPNARGIRSGIDFDPSVEDCRDLWLAVRKRRLASSSSCRADDGGKNNVGGGGGDVATAIDAIIHESSQGYQQKQHMRQLLLDGGSPSWGRILPRSWGGVGVSIASGSSDEEDDARRRRSPLGSKKKVTNENVRSVFGDQPPLETVFVKEGELYEIMANGSGGDFGGDDVVRRSMLPFEFDGDACLPLTLLNKFVFG